MARRIQRHSTRLSQVHEGALDTAFRVGQRVQTIDNLPGRVLFVSAAFAPGVTEYQVQLDNGMGAGTYTASQLRPVPEDYRAGAQPIPPGLLPAGVTGAYITEDQARQRWRETPEYAAGMTAEEALRAQAADIHTADLDYPEMGTVLHDRPDPGAEIRVIGHRKTAASHSYGGPEDPRDEDYNGGEQDTGMYWAEPGQQQWMHDNIGPQEEAPPPLMMAPEEPMPPSLARLAEIQEAQELIGQRHHATSINGQQIDDHGDAPEHGTTPRAEEPNAYDDQSTEGDGDPKWSGDSDPDKHDKNAATVGMYPEGMSAGGGPGLEIGAFTANVPWTGEERGHLHSWDNGASAQAGDFVSSAQFTNKVPVTQEIEQPAPEIIAADLRAQGSMPAGQDLVSHLIIDHGMQHHEIGAWGTAAQQHDEIHAEGDPRDYAYSGGHPHMHIAPYENNTALWAGTDRPVARELEHERPWDRGRVMHTLSQRTAADENAWARHLRAEHGYTDEGIARILGGGNSPSHIHAGLHDAGMANHSHDAVTYSEPYPASPYAAGEGGRQDPDPEAAVYDSRPVQPIDPATWPEDVRRRYLSARQAGVRVKVHGPNDFSLHQAPDEHDDDANDLDSPVVRKGNEAQDSTSDAEEDKNSLDYGNPQASELSGPDNDPDNSLDNPPAGLAAPDPNASMTGPDAEAENGRSLPPTAWPMTQAPIQQGGPAYTQGTHDQHGRVFPPPPPAPAPDIAGGGEPGQDPAVPEGDGKKVQLEIKTAGTEEAITDRFGKPAQVTPKNWAVRPESGGAQAADPEHAVTDSEPVEARDPEDLPWAERARRLSARTALLAFEASAASPAFRFEFTAAWTDVVAKAKRLRTAGRVRITHASQGMVIGEVGGDHDVYESGIQRAPGHPQSIQHWACGCPWGTFRQNKTAARRSRLNGRPCSHVMALQFEALSRTRRYEKVDQDPSAADLGVPHQVVVKSEPPWTSGGWAKTWLAPAASLHTAAPGDADWAEPGDPRQHLHDEHGMPHEWMHGLDPEDLVRRHKFKHQQDEWETGSHPGHDHHLFGQEFNPYGESSDYIPDFEGGHNQNPRRPDLDREFHRYQDALELGQETAPWEESPEYTPPGDLLKHHLSSLGSQECYYRHDGPCPDLGNSYTAESIRHPRPSGFYSEIEPNPLHDPTGMLPRYLASHVLTGYVAGRPVGRLHFSQSDDGQASEVHMMHSLAPGKGIASAMMDDLYSHVKSNGRWLDHGTRTEEGNNWWASYREPHPEINTHHVDPKKGWAKYWAPYRVAQDAEENRKASGGQGAHTPVRYNPNKYPLDDRDQEWTQSRISAAARRQQVLQFGVSPAQQATAALLAAGENQDEVAALAMLAGVQRDAIKRTLIHQADQTNAPWGSENVTKHPPQKPYGATEPLNKDQSPASYGFLTDPDPDNWGSIQEDSALQMPLSNTGSHHVALSSPEHKVLVPGAAQPLPAGLNYPDVGDFHEDQSSFTYTDRANTAGPSTSITPRDPGGIRMEESLDPQADAEEFRRHLVTMHGQPDVDWLAQDWGKHIRDHEDAVRAREISEPLEYYTGYQPHPYQEMAHERRHIRDQWPDAMHYEGELKDEPDAALDPDGLTAEEFQDCGEAARQAAGIDGTAGDAQDVPHGFENDLDDGCGGCRMCGLSPDAAVHHTAAADGTIGGGDAGSGTSDQEPADVAALGEFGAARRAALRRRFGGTPMGDQSIAEGLSGGAQTPSPVTQEPGMGSGDEYLTPDDSSIQTVGQQQWSGGGADSDEVDVPASEPQGSLDDIVASFQRSAAAGQYGGDGSQPGSGPGAGDIARAAQAFLKTAEVLPDAEAQELIGEGKGTRARNLGLLRLEGTHYEDEDADLERRGLNLDDFDDDVISV